MLERLLIERFLIFSLQTFHAILSPVLSFAKCLLIWYFTLPLINRDCDHISSSASSRIMSQCEEVLFIIPEHDTKYVKKKNKNKTSFCFPLFYWETETTMVSTLCKVLCSMRQQQCRRYGFTDTLDISGSARISEHFHQLVPHNRFTFNKQMHGKKIYEILTSQFTLCNFQQWPTSFRQ